MAEPPPPSTPNPIPPSGSAPPPAPSTSAPPQQPPAAPTLKPREPLTGFRASLEHTGVPRSVLTWRPRLPSRNWTIFLTVVGTITYLYYDDRRQCKAIREEYLDRVRYRGLEPTRASLELPRKVRVIGAKWPEDDDDDRALRYFRKYVKPYLVAAAIDYGQMSAPLHGSITRQLHAQILKKRREALGLQAPLAGLPLPVTVDPKEAEQRELEGGTVIVGRASLKEYLEGMKRGWLGRVDDWDWEKSIGDELDKDGMFDRKPDPTIQSFDTDPPVPDVVPAPSSPNTPFSPPGGSPLHNSLSFLSRPPPPSLSRTAPQGESDTPAPIPESMQIPPYPLPPQPPILFVPFISRLGFRQVPWMLYDFFTERYRVKSGAEAALALIEGHTREFRGLDGTGSGLTSEILLDSASPSPSSSASPTARDTDFGTGTENWYKKSFRELPDRTATARNDYNAKLEERIRDVYDLEDGRRQLTDDEKKSTKPLTTIQNLKDERRKKELRWKGSEEGYEIIKPGSPVAWDERMDGWLRVFELDPASVGPPIESDMGAGEGTS